MRTLMKKGMQKRIKNQVHCGPKKLTIQTKVLGQLLVRLLICLHHSFFFVTVRRSVRPSVGRSVTLYFFCIFKLFEGTVEEFRGEYFMNVKLLSAPAQLIFAPAQLNTALAQPPATGLSCIRPCYNAHLLRALCCIHSFPHPLTHSFPTHGKINH